MFNQALAAIFASFARAIPKVFTSRRVTSFVFAAVVAPLIAHAQSFPGSFPRPLAPNTYVSTGTPCPGGTGTTRAFTDYQFNVATTGSYTFSVVRRTGNGLRIDRFTGTFNPASTCTNWVDGTTSASNTAVLTTNLATPGAYTLIIAGVSAADSATFDVTVTGPATSRLEPICTNSTVVPATQTGVVAAGAAATTVITPATGCWFWNTSNVPSWIPNFPVNAAGPTAVNYNVATNPTTTARSQTITIGYESRDAAGENPQAGSGTRSLSVSQLANATTCTYGLSTSSAMATMAGGSGNFNVNGSSGSCTFTANSNASWITGVSISGGNSVNYTVAANVGLPRTSTITAAGLTFTITQAGLKILSIAGSGNGHILLQCTGVPNQVNNLQVSPDLSPGSFTTIVPAPVAADATGAFPYDDTGAVGLTKRFYRLAPP